MKQIVFLFLSIGFIINGCGYKSTKQFAKEQLSGKVFLALDINQDNIQQSIILRNQIIKMIHNDLDGIVVEKKHNADSYVEAKIMSINHSALKTDSEGFTNRYRSTVDIIFLYENKKDHKTKLESSGYFDYAVSSNASETEKNKLQAVQNATQNALESILSQLAIHAK